MMEKKLIEIKFNRSRFTDTEDKRVVTSGEAEEAGGRRVKGTNDQVYNELRYTVPPGEHSQHFTVTANAV